MNGPQQGLRVYCFDIYTVPACLMIRTLNEIQNCSHYLTENFLDNRVVISHISLEYEADCEATVHWGNS